MPRKNTAKSAGKALDALEGPWSIEQKTALVIPARTIGITGAGQVNYQFGERKPFGERAFGST
jgi:hypothetical protein